MRIRRIFTGNYGHGAGPGPAGNIVVMSFSAGLAGAAAVIALRLFVPGLASLVSPVTAPLVCGGVAFVATLLTLLSVRSGTDPE